MKSLSCGLWDRRCVEQQTDELPSDGNIQTVNNFSNCTFVCFSGIILVSYGYWQELGDFKTRRAHSSICV